MILVVGIPPSFIAKACFRIAAWIERASEDFAFWDWLMKFGMAIELSMPIMTKTMSSSVNVNPVLMLD